MGSPTGIFAGLTAAELASLKTTALARIIAGDFTQLSGASKSSSKEYSMTPQEMLVEIRFAEGTLPPQTIYEDFRALRPMPGTVQA